MSKPRVTVYVVKAAKLLKIECEDYPKTWVPVGEAGSFLLGKRIRKEEPGLVAETPEKAWRLAVARLHAERDYELRLSQLHKQRADDLDVLLDQTTAAGDLWPEESS